ncbi:Hypothetical predicted protein [Pelobates cultripes]|uniref:Uncharacterized protein n=1 Tax=Pelobates cultripes TaxID=61616 RepID=A0AAD1WDZ9_PELCU|nr:Hypothetical predicted protein [Pelobates cultripes]
MAESQSTSDTRQAMPDGCATLDRMLLHLDEILARFWEQLELRAAEGAGGQRSGLKRTREGVQGAPSGTTTYPASNRHAHSPPGQKANREPIPKQQQTHRKALQQPITHSLLKRFTTLQRQPMAPVKRKAPKRWRVKQHTPHQLQAPHERALLKRKPADTPEATVETSTLVSGLTLRPTRKPGSTRHLSQRRDWALPLTGIG